MSISAIIWDFDGTIADNSQKHMIVTKEIISHIKPDIESKGWPLGLTSLEEYRTAVSRTLDWSDVYKTDFGLNEEEALSAGELWSKFQLENKTPVDCYPGLPQIIRKFSAIPQAICSLNCSINIKKQLECFNLADSFRLVLGYNNIPMDTFKPKPDSFLYCLEQMKINPEEGTIVYIGDHEEDTQFARNAQQALNSNQTTIINIAACYSGSDPSKWRVNPDYEAYSADELFFILNNINNQ